MSEASLSPSQHAVELNSGQRYAFGNNWRRFLSSLNDKRIEDAQKSLVSMLGVDDLSGKSFLDIGSGSGLFSLAARRLGAKVVSFDYDPDSVLCTKTLKDHFFLNDPDWTIEEGSILDGKYIEQLGKFDVVYSWGVLHHTGSMWEACENAHKLVKPHGLLFIAIYNSQPAASKYWLFIKRFYNKNRWARPILIAMHIIYPMGPSFLARKLMRRKTNRGMNIWRDLFDWLGGYPFEVAKPEEIFQFYQIRNYRLFKLKTVGGRLGCNEYVFNKA